MKWFLIAALVLAASPANAGPFSAAIAAFSGAIGGGAGVFAGIGAAYTALTSTFLGKMIVGAAFSLAGQLFAPKPTAIKDQGIQTEQTTTGDTTPLKFVVGRYGLEGHAIAPAYSRDTNNRILTYILELSNLPLTGLTGRVIVDGQYTTLTAAGDDPSRLDFSDFGTDSAGNPRGWLWFFDGTQTTAFWHLVAQYENHPDRPWTSDHKLLESAYAICEFPFDREIYNGLPAMRFEVDGIALYDPREDTTVGGSGSQRWADPSTWTFTKNPQVINYNILRGITLPTGEIWGGEVPAEDLPLDNWFAAMNECDTLIGSRVQYQAGFEINTGTMQPWEVIEEMNRASFAQISEFGGVFRVRVGAPATPVLSLTDDDFVITEGARYDPFPGLAQTFNAATGTYIEPEDLWQGRSADAVLNAAWETEDGGRRLPMGFDLPAVSNKSQAQQLLTAYIADQRRFRAHRMVLPPSFAMVEPLDTISFTSDVYGYTSKTFEVLEVEHRANTLNQSVLVRERDAADVAWTSGDDVPAPTAVYSLTLPSTFVDLEDEDTDTIWNGRFAKGTRGWSFDLETPATQSVVLRDSASAHDALQVAQAKEVLQLDTGGGLINNSLTETYVNWDGFIPVSPDRMVFMQFWVAAGNNDATYATNFAQCRGVLRWYDETQTQLSSPDDETTDYIIQASNTDVVSLGLPLWVHFQRTGLPPEGAAFCKPSIEIKTFQGLVFITDVVVGSALDTSRLEINSVTDIAATAFSSTTLATNNVLESLATATVEVPTLASGSSGESLAIDAKGYANITFSGAATLVLRLQVDGVTVASGATSSNGVVSLFASTTKGPGEYDVELLAEADDVTRVSLSEGQVHGRVFKR